MIDQDFSGADHVIDSQEASSYHFINAREVGTVQSPKQPLSYGSKITYDELQNSRQVYQTPLAPYSGSTQFYSTDAQARPYDGLYPPPPPNPAAVDGTDDSQAFYPPDMAPIARTTSDASEHDSSTAEGLSEALGELKIDECGTGRHPFELFGDDPRLTFLQAPYLRRPSRNVAEAAAPTRDKEIELPPLDTRYGSQIRIPPALMPSDEDAAHFFKIFFSEVHPYVPVANRHSFYRQWQSDRNSISPLLLEAMLACAGRLSDDPAQGAQWLALANSQ